MKSKIYRYDVKYDLHGDGIVIETPIKKAYKYDAGYDIEPIEDNIIIPCGGSINLTFPYKCKLKKNECAFITLRSSTMNVGIINLVPIDSGYTGNCLHITMFNNSFTYKSIPKNAFQLVIVKIPRIKGSRLKRGNKWNGSSNKLKGGE